MHFENRWIGKKKHHYLAHSVREGEKVRKVRKYLGADLSEKELEEARKSAEVEIQKKIFKDKIPEISTDSVELKEPLEKKEQSRISEFIKTGFESFDSLFSKGITKGISILIAGGPGTGKTILTLQLANSFCNQGKKVFYMSFEESEERLREHMEGFGWNPQEFEKNGFLAIKRFNPFKLSRSIEGLLAKARGELLIDIGMEDLLPKGFKPDIIMLDSISALAAGFTSGSDTYRVYIEQLFRYFEKLGVTSFMISETEDAPKKLSDSGVEEFLADGVIVMYYLKHGNIRERAIEVLKLRGSKHTEKIVAIEITENGMVIYPEQEIFGE